MSVIGPHIIGRRLGMAGRDSGRPPTELLPQLRVDELLDELISRVNQIRRRPGRAWRGRRCGS
jgi:hypothetical protein